ncbi:MAG: YggS family pyridoxal phosphate-dependent enzyme [Eubacteriales bacterium]|nr:YggS family pyridoxal phosphate-dependent enzyme [Eubacteriales bacterium]
MDNEQIARVAGLTVAEVEALSSRLAQVRLSVAAAAQAAGRDPAEITLVGVSKFLPASMAAAAVCLGLQDLGENRVQEMLAKQDDLTARSLHPAWHLIGTLQKNKVKYLLGRTALIHSVDSADLLQEIASRSTKAGLVTDVLLQVNTAHEATKHGFDPDELITGASSFSEQSGVRIRGLMTMAPLFADPELARPVFAQTQELFASLAEGPLGTAFFNNLSMGMSQDYIQAIACGATHVRIGTAIFGPRPPLV